MFSVWWNFSAGASDDANMPLVDTIDRQRPKKVTYEQLDLKCETTIPFDWEKFPDDTKMVCLISITPAYD